MNVVRWMDGAAEGAVAGMHRPWLDAILVGVTHLGDETALTAVTLLAVAVLLFRRMRRTALVVAFAALASFPLSESIKDVVDRGRPDVPWRVIPLPRSWSFPSGHALGSMTVYGTLGLIAGRRLPRRRLRVAAACLGLALPLLIGFSRVYLGVHWLSDVLAGWAMGLTLVLLAAGIERLAACFGRRRGSRPAVNSSPSAPPGRAGPA